MPTLLEPSLGRLIQEIKEKHVLLILIFVSGSAWRSCDGQLLFPLSDLLKFILYS